MRSALYTKKELEIRLGEAIKTIRLVRNIDRQSVCDSAGISVNALRHLENGTGASVKTLISIVIELNKADWVLSIAPTVSINPLHKGKLRKRASSRSRSELVPRKRELRKYGITFTRYLAMHSEQNGKCGNLGCSVVLDPYSRLTHVDHDHLTGKVRSLLCAHCNCALGFIRENVPATLGLADYITKHALKSS